MYILPIYTVQPIVPISDALDWDRCLEIIAAYGSGFRVLRLIQTYWYLLTIVARAIRYFEIPFKGYHGVTQV